MRIRISSEVSRLYAEDDDKINKAKHQRGRDEAWRGVEAERSVGWRTRALPAPPRYPPSPSSARQCHCPRDSAAPCAASRARPAFFSTTPSLAIAVPAQAAPLPLRHAHAHGRRRLPLPPQLHPIDPSARARLPPSPPPDSSTSECACAWGSHGRLPRCTSCAWRGGPAARVPRSGSNPSKEGREVEGPAPAPAQLGVRPKSAPPRPRPGSRDQRCGRERAPPRRRGRQAARAGVAEEARGTGGGGRRVGAPPRVGDAVLRQPHGDDRGVRPGRPQPAQLRPGVHQGLRALGRRVPAQGGVRHRPQLHPAHAAAPELRENNGLP